MSDFLIDILHGVILVREKLSTEAWMEHSLNDIDTFSGLEALMFPYVLYVSFYMSTL